MKSLSLKRFSSFFILLIVSFSLLFSGCKKDETTDDSSNDSDSSTNDDKDTGTEDIVDFSMDAQAIGEYDEDVDYDLVSIEDSRVADYHEFEFKFQSSSSKLPLVTASLNSASGYIEVIIKGVSTDNSGIAYQSSRTVNQDGIVNIYHAISSNENESIYNIGIDSDVEFRLREGDGLSVWLDVIYPDMSNGPDDAADDDSGDFDSSGSDDEDDTDAVADPNVFSNNTQTFSTVNSSGDVSLVRYSWAIEGDVLKFVWETSSNSANKIPPVTATYNATNKTVTVKFSNLQKDSICGTDNVIDTELSGISPSMSGSFASGTSTYTFKLTKETTYKISKSDSPSQVIIEIKR
ncbi:hypothetical protein JW887_01755 [Candidatus Dojkabacteria bacterium]|nr:hypothetical protein [Candidatus Dojkabacteria bacterium]